jgi:hypothetical protein
MMAALCLGALLGAVTVGCSKQAAEVDPEVQRRKSELSEVYEIYMQFIKTNQRPPKQLSELNRTEYEGMAPVGHQSLQKGEYIAVWGVNGKDAGTLLAYQKDVPTKGGAVLMADGTVKTMTADEFKAAKKS